MVLSKDLVENSYTLYSILYKKRVNRQTFLKKKYLFGEHMKPPGKIQKKVLLEAGRKEQIFSKIVSMTSGELMVILFPRNWSNVLKVFRWNLCSVDIAFFRRYPSLRTDISEIGLAGCFRSFVQPVLVEYKISVWIPRLGMFVYFKKSQYRWSYWNIVLETHRCFAACCL